MRKSFRSWAGTLVKRSYQAVQEQTILISNGAPELMEPNSHRVLVIHKVWRKCREAEGRAQCDSS